MQTSRNPEINTDWYGRFHSFQKGQEVYAYYTITNLSKSIEFPMHIQNLLTQPSTLKPSNLLRIVNFSLPTLYTNSTANMSADVLYTGTTEQPVYFYLTAPPGITVNNATQSVNATPNLLISKRFGIVTKGTTGTIILTLYVNTQGTNITYSLPLVVLQKQQFNQGGGSTSIPAGVSTET